MKHIRLVGITLLTFFMSGALVASAGSLTPSASPAATMKTLQEVYDSVAGTFDASAITASATGSLIQQLKYLTANLGWSVSGNNLTDAVSGTVTINSVAITAGAVSGVTTLSASGAIAANGGITFDAATDTLGAHTLAGTLDANTNILTNIGNAGTDFVASTGALTLAGILTANGGISVADVTTELAFASTSPTVSTANGGTLAFTDGTNTLLSVVDQGAYPTMRIAGKSDTGDPATCTAGDLYFNSNDTTVKACTATNTWEALDGGSAAWSALTDPAANLALAAAEYTNTITWNTAASSAAFNGFTLAMNNDASTDGGNQRVLVLSNANDGGATGTTEALLYLDNADANEVVTAGIEFANSGSGGYTAGINMGNQIIVNIGNAGTDFDTNGGLALAADLTVTGGDITGANSIALDLGEAGNGATWTLNRTVASAAGATWGAFSIPATTATISGSTNITTAAGFNLVSIAQPTLSAASALTVSSAATFYVAAAPTGSGGGPASITNAYALWADAGTVRIDGDTIVGGSTSATETIADGSFSLGGDDLFVAGTAGIEGAVYTDGGFNTSAGQNSFTPGMTVASGASATWNGFTIPAATATITGSTNITTSTGFNLANIAQPTLSGTVIVSNAASLYVAAAPTMSGGGSISNAYSIWADAGNVRFDGELLQGDGTTTQSKTAGFLYLNSVTTGNPSGTPASYTGYVPVTYNTTNDRICVYNSSWQCLSMAGGSAAWSSLTSPTGNLSLSMAEYTSTMAWNTASSSAAFNGLTLSITNDASTDGGNQRVLVLSDMNDGGSTGTTEALLYLDNADANEAVTAAIELASSGGGNFTYGIDMSGYQIYDTTQVSSTSGLSLSTSAGALSFSSTRTIASGASATWGGIGISASTTITGSTNITTAAGFNMITISQPTISDNDAGTVTISNAATLYVGGAPTSGGTTPPTISNAYSIWADAGNVRFDGELLQGDGTTTQSKTAGFLYLNSVTTGNPSGTPASYTGYVPVTYNTTNDRICVYNSSWQCLSMAGGSATWNTISNPSGNQALSMAEYTSTWTWDTAASSAAFNGLTLAMNNDASTDGGNQRVLVLSNSNDGGNTGATEAMLYIDNADTNEMVNAAIEITSSGGMPYNTADIVGTKTPNAMSSEGAIEITGTITEAASNTHPLLTTVSIDPATVTAGNATVTNTATLYISGAMSATVTGSNYALWTDNGINRFDYDIFQSDGTTTTTKTTGFLWMNSTAGAPTGNPTEAPTGLMAFTWDSTNNKLCVNEASDTTWICTAALSDIAEWMPAAGAEPGDLVSLTDALNPTGDATAPFMLGRTSGTYDRRMVGVVSEYAEDIGMAQGYKRSEDYHAVALVGRVPVKVTAMNGAIVRGDRLTSSDLAGVAMKATAEGPTVGIALEDYRGAGVGKILVYVNLGWNHLDSGAVAAASGGTVFADANGKVTLAGDLDLDGKNIVNIGALLGANGAWELSADGNLIVQDLEVKGTFKLRDSANGDVYCVGIENGIFRQEPCGTPPPSATETVAPTAETTSASVDAAPVVETSAAPESMAVSAEASTATEAAVTAPEPAPVETAPQPIVEEPVAVPAAGTVTTSEATAMDTAAAPDTSSATVGEPPAESTP